MYIVARYPREVLAARPRSADDFQGELQEIEIGKLTIDAQGIMGRKVRALASKERADSPIRVISFRKKFYVIDGRHRAMRAIVSGTDKIPAYVLHLEPEPEVQKSRSHVVTDKAT